MTTKLSEYFTLSELTVSQAATRKGIDNTPGPEALANLTKLAKTLDKVRVLLGRPVLISSGFRNLAVNTLIGSKAGSHHVLGLAADFTCPSYDSLDSIFSAIKRSGIAYDQLILEYPQRSGWIHIGLGPKMRQQNLIYDGKSYLITS